MNDSEIIGLYRRRSEQAIEETQKQYGTRLQRLSLSVTHSEQDAEECVNDAYLRAWNSIPPELPQSLFAYLAAIVRRLSLDVVDRMNAAKRAGPVVELTAELAECLPDADEDANESDSAAIRHAIQAFLDGESDDVRDLFVRRYFWMEPVDEIARETGRSVSGVHSALFRARRQLRKVLEKEGITL